MTEYSIYKAKLDCSHVSDWADRNPPHMGAEIYCPICREFGGVIAVYLVTRDIEEIEEMLE